MKTEFGNLNNLDTEDTGWVVGFGKWLEEKSLRYVDPNQSLKGLCIKWKHHLMGELKSGMPKSTGKTLSILVSDDGNLELTFSSSATFDSKDTNIYILKKLGDFIIWGEDLYHKAEFKLDSSILTIRWDHKDL